MLDNNLDNSLDNSLDNYKGQMNASEQVLIDGAKLLFGPTGRDLLPHNAGSNIDQFHQHLTRAVFLQQNLQDEVKIFRLLAKLATRRIMKSFALEFEVVEDIRKLLSQTDTANHPGLHHYLVHAVESPFMARHAQMDALNAVHWLENLNSNGNNSSSIHLTHIPTHFYFARGDWFRVTQINQLAWDKSIERKNDINENANNSSLTDASLAFHEHLWLVYSLLQQGQWDQAWHISQDLHQRLTNLTIEGASADDVRVLKTYYAFEKAYLKLELPVNDGRIATLNSQTLDETGISPWGLLALRFIAVWDALQVKDFDTSKTARLEFMAIKNEPAFNIYPANVDAHAVMLKQLEAEEYRQRDNLKQAIITIESVVSDYDNMRWDHGVPLVVKPIREYLGELYLEELHLTQQAPVITYQGGEPQKDTPVPVTVNDNTKKAIEQFQTELTDNFPGRRQSLQGIIIAAAGSTSQAEAQATIDSMDQPLTYDSEETPTPPEPDSSLVETGKPLIVLTMLVMAAVMKI